MARFLGPKLKLSRREGVDLNLKSAERSLESKCRFPVKPGMHGKQLSGKLSDYASQLREKQKLRRMYGILEKQFRCLFSLAETKKGSVGLNMLLLLESRLDNLVYRAGFARTRAEARQIVSHNGVFLEGKKINVPSTFVHVGTKVSLSEKAKSSLRVSESIDVNSRSGRSCTWLDVNLPEKSFVFKALPDRADFAHDVKENLVVQMFSR